MWNEILLILRENTETVLISVSSFSFQIAGAVILLLWSLRKCDETIKSQCLHSGDILCGNFDETGTYTDISKEELQKAAKYIYKNIVAFANILIGYVCAIFSENAPLPNWIILVLVVALTALILLLENGLVGWIAKKRYPSDERVYEEPKN
jgi:hypothetical protein